MQDRAEAKIDIFQIFWGYFIKNQIKQSTANLTSKKEEKPLNTSNI